MNEGSEAHLPYGAASDVGCLYRAHRALCTVACVPLCIGPLARIQARHAAFDYFVVGLSLGLIPLARVVYAALRFFHFR